MGQKGLRAALVALAATLVLVPAAQPNRPGPNPRAGWYAGNVERQWSKPGIQLQLRRGAIRQVYLGLKARCEGPAGTDPRGASPYIPTRLRVAVNRRTGRFGVRGAAAGEGTRLTLRGRFVSRTRARGTVRWRSTDPDGTSCDSGVREFRVRFAGREPRANRDA